MKNIEEILAEAPISKVYGFPLAFTCTGCSWWTNDWRVPTKDDKGVLHCLLCSSPLRFFPLEVFLRTTQEENPEHLEGFLRAFSGNFEVREEGGCSQE